MRPLLSEVIINSEQYQECFDPNNFSIGRSESDGWFQHGGAMTQPTVRATVLQDLSSERIVSLGFWPPSSLDLTQPDFFL